MALVVQIDSPEKEEDEHHRFTLGVDNPEPDMVAWVPLTLSIVEYPKGDLLGFILALSSLAPITLHSGFLTLILFRRDLFTIFFYLGFCLNAPVNQLLKHVVKEPRPIRDRRQFGIYGMPSSHSQHVWFFAVFFILLLVIRFPEGNPMEKWTLMGILMMLAGVVGFGRIYLKYHTWTQVVVGGTIGSVAAGFWFTLTHFIFTSWFPTIVSWSISEYLLIRDTSSIEHLLWFEYNNTINQGRMEHRIISPS